MPGWLVDLTLLAIALGAVSANVLNIYSGAMSFLTLGVRLPLSLRRALVAVVFGVIGFLLAWSGLHDAGSKYENFLLIIAYWIGPWLGVMFTDQFLRRGQRIDGLLYAKWYQNWAGPIAMLIGIVVSILLFSNQTDFTGFVAKRVPGLGDIAFLVGFVLAAAIYAGLRPHLGATRPHHPRAWTPSTPAGGRHWLACRAAFSSIPLPLRERTSTVPVVELRRKSRPRVAGQVLGLDDAAVRQGDPGARGDIQARLDDAVVAKRDADAGVGADQAAFAYGDDLLAAAGERAHDGRAAADVRAVADDDATGDPAFHHGRAERAGVEVDEALVHHRGAAGQVRAQPNPVRVGDPYAGGQHVVDHSGELVHTEHGDRPAARSASLVDSKPSTGHGPWLVHTTFDSSPNTPSMLQPCGWISRDDNRCSRRYTSCASTAGSASDAIDVRTATTSTPRSVSGPSVSATDGAELRHGLLGGQHDRVLPASVAAELGLRVPGVQHGAVTGHRGQADGVRAVRGYVHADHRNRCRTRLTAAQGLAGVLASALAMASRSLPIAVRAAGQPPRCAVLGVLLTLSHAIDW